jgi:hypothetical protein
MAIIPSDEKVIMVSSTANTTYSGSKALKETAEWYTMQDVTDTVRPYKVYTALLTQSGDSVPAEISEGALIVGVTYEIIFGSIGMDFTNVGAPNNNLGTFFVATGTTPNSWGAGEGGFKKILSYNTGAPVATVLENTIGNIYFAYNGVGYYQVSSDPESLFPVGKTFGFIGSVGDDIASASYGFLRSNGTYFYILTKDFASDSNNQLNNTPIEIRVYN